VRYPNWEVPYRAWDEHGITFRWLWQWGDAAVGWVVDYDEVEEGRAVLD